MRLLPLAAALTLTACVGTSPAARNQAEKLSYAPTAAEPMTCVPIRSIRQTRVLDDRTIDFVLTGGERVRNTLPVSCPGLRSEDGISYRTSLSRLCNVDIVTALNRTGGRILQGASCGLGQFQPVARAAL